VADLPVDQALTASSNAAARNKRCGFLLSISIQLHPTRLRAKIGGAAHPPRFQEKEIRMKGGQQGGISFYQRHLTIWVLLCMVAGVLIGRFVPEVPEALGSLEVAGISIPIAVLIWVMIYPMMIKVDFQSVREVGRHPKGLFVTWIVNWLVKPFTMYGFACLFLTVVFKSLIPQDLATGYLAGAVLLGAAPCTAMVFVWSALTRGNPAYTVVQVATNDLIILAAFAPIVKFLLGVSHVDVPYATLLVSVFLFVVIPLAAGIITRVAVTRRKGREYLENVFVHKFDNATTAGLLLTLVIIFSSQSAVIIANPLHIVLIAVPLIIQTFAIFFLAYGACRVLRLPFSIAAPAGMIGASNFFELAVAVAIALFGTTSPAALATTVGVLTEVPVMLTLVKIANRTKGWFSDAE
jgi:ACR3 family arsenite transporter